MSFVARSFTLALLLVSLPVIALAEKRSDFNGDGRSDILLQHTDGTVAIWIMNGMTITTAGVVHQPAPSWRVVATGDFNGDLKSDIVLQQDVPAGDVAVWLMDGLTIVNTATVGKPGQEWVALLAGDFNADSRADLVLRNTNSGEIAMWLMTGFTITAGAVIGAPNAAWVPRATGDFNGDGRSDIALQNTQNGAQAVWVMNGLQITFGGALQLQSPWIVKGAGNFDGNQNDELLIRRPSDSAIVRWHLEFNNPPRVWIAGSVIGTPGTAWDVRGAADYNGDGEADILLQQNDGAVGMWLINGDPWTGSAPFNTQVTSGGVVGTASTSWTPIVR